jgi:hypothetical protein
VTISPALALDILDICAIARGGGRQVPAALTRVAEHLAAAHNLAAGGHLALCIRCSCAMFGGWCVECGWSADDGLAPVLAIRPRPSPAAPAAVALAG